MNRRSALVALAILVSAVSSNIAHAQPAGEAVAVDQTATAAGTAGLRTLTVSDPVFMGDLVTTDAAGQAQLLFGDDTRMVVGPNSELTIDSFIFADESTASQVTLNATRGVFRFITGNSPKPAYLIDTPVATIGVRGSRADIEIPDEDTVNVVFYSERGARADGEGHGIYVCDKPEFRQTDRNRRHCVELTEGCSYVTLRRGEEPVRVNNVYTRTQMMDDIPFAFRQGRLGTLWRVDSRACNIRDLSVPDGDSDNGELIPPEREPPPLDDDDCDECNEG